MINVIYINIYIYDITIQILLCLISGRLFFFLFLVFDMFLLYMIYIKIQKWIKLFSQGVVSIGFGIAYISFPGDEKFPLTAFVLFTLAVALFYQGRRARIHPDKSPY